MEHFGSESIDVELLKRFDKPVPRYTSYPTAPEWGSLTPHEYQQQLSTLKNAQAPLSLYFHVPFCKTMCLFCGCSVILNRRPENEERYVAYLLKEIDLVANHLNEGQIVRQLHFGGGTPTKLSIELLEKIMQKLRSRFQFPNAEISIEIDPRTVFEDKGQKLRGLYDLGFNRVSFGVQDIHDDVQEAVRRRQSYEMTLTTYQLAREVGFSGINVDLIYGLPLQTADKFKDTIDKIVQMHPDRIALFSYAKIPWLKEHQKAIPDETLPSTEEKFKIYVQARQQLLAGGYLGLGMDHFALKNDPLAVAFCEGKLHRNFQGYTLNLAEDMLGFGVTSIGYCRDAYIQNIKELEPYYAALDRGELPVQRGIVLSESDRLRRWVINKLMCQFELDKDQFGKIYGVPFQRYFAAELSSIQEAIDDGLLIDKENKLVATPTGRLFIRNIASLFDWYLQQKSGVGNFSKGI